MVMGASVQHMMQQARHTTISFDILLDFGHIRSSTAVDAWMLQDYFSCVYVATTLLGADGHCLCVCYCHSDGGLMFSQGLTQHHLCYLLHRMIVLRSLCDDHVNIDCFVGMLVLASRLLFRST